MSAIAKTTSTYLNRAVDTLRSLGLTMPQPDSSAIVTLTRRLAEIDEPRVAIIARTLAEQQSFDSLVSEQVDEMDVGERHIEIARSFDSIRDDAKRMVDQASAPKVGLLDRLSNTVMKVTRGDIASRFDAIASTHREVTASLGDQIRREETILEAYQDYRIALKEAEVLAQEVLAKASPLLEAAKTSLSDATAAVEAAPQGVERSRLEIAREEARRRLATEDDRYQVAKDLSENISISYNVTEVTMSRLLQAHVAKKRVFDQSVSFFSTNSSILSALKASYTGMAGLKEATATHEALKEGMSRSLETLGEIGGQVQKDALRAGYGPTIRHDAVKALVDSIVKYQEESAVIVAEARKASTENAAAIRQTTEEGRRRLADLSLKAAQN
jgi:hypothetical protein